MILDRVAVLRVFKKLLGSSKPVNGLDELQIQLRSNPSDCNLLIQIGDLYLKNNENSQAVKYFQKAVDRYCADGFITKAIAVLKRIQRINPRDVQIRTKLSELYYGLGLMNEAKSELVFVVEQNARDGKQKENLSLFNKLLEIDPQSLDIRSQLAAAYEDQNLISEAVGLYLEISQQYIHRERQEEAVAALRRARALSPQNAAALWKLLWLFLERDETAEARKLLEEFIATHNVDSEILGLVVKTFTQDSQIGKMHQLINEILEEKPANESFRILKAELYLKVGAYESALAQFTFVIDQMKKRGEYNRPALLLKRVTRCDSSFYPAWKMLIDFYIVRGLDKNLPEAYSALADAYISRKMYNEASECLRILLKIDSANRWHSEKLNFVRSFLIEPEETISAKQLREEIEIEIDLDEQLEIDSADMQAAAGVQEAPKKPVEITIQAESPICEENIIKAS